MDEPDYQIMTLVIERRADEHGCEYTIYSALGREQGQEPLGVGTGLETALHNAELQARFLKHATWVG
jgi:hypothetical protein